MEEVTGEPLYRDRVCGIDIGKAGMVATIRMPSDKDPSRRAQETRSFGTTKKEVLALADWLRCWQVPAAVMEATGDYWKGPFYRLEAEGFDCVLADAKQVKNLPGRPPEARSPTSSGKPPTSSQPNTARHSRSPSALITPPTPNAPSSSGKKSGPPGRRPGRPTTRCWSSCRARA